MLNRTKHLIKVCLSWCLILIFLLLYSPAKAQFIGLNLDLAIAYSAAPGSVSGGSVGITHPVPLFPNLGVSSISFQEKQSETFLYWIRHINIHIRTCHHNKFYISIRRNIFLKTKKSDCIKRITHDKRPL